MKNIRKHLNIPTPVILAAGVLSVFTESAYAYLDPGTGSIILQGIIAAIAVGLTTAKLWWYRITSLFSRKKPDTEENADS